MTTWRVRGVVNRVVDGDTFDCDFDLGWGIWRKSVPGVPCRVRVLGIDAPEMSDKPAGPNAKLLVESLLPPGTEVWVESWRLDSFGRALCNVTFPDGQNLLSFLPVEWRV